MVLEKYFSVRESVRWRVKEGKRKENKDRGGYVMWERRCVRLMRN
jgi:hypothetical protein